MDAVSREVIANWLEKAKLNKCTHLIVACDTYDYEDYPIFCESAQECLDSFKEHNGKNMQRVMEVYDLSLPIEAQLNERFAMHLPGERE